MGTHTLCQPREGLSFLVKNCFVYKELDVYIQYLGKRGRCLLHLRRIDQQKLSKAQGYKHLQNPLETWVVGVVAVSPVVVSIIWAPLCLEHQQEFSKSSNL